MEPNWKGLKSWEDFREIKEKGNGYVVITDIANPNKIHRPDCGWVKEDYFVTKVITNGGRNGNYYWTDDLDFASKKWDAGPCARCICETR